MLTHLKSDTQRQFFPSCRNWPKYAHMLLWTNFICDKRLCQWWPSSGMTFNNTRTTALAVQQGQFLEVPLTQGQFPILPFKQANTHLTIMPWRFTRRCDILQCRSILFLSRACHQYVVQWEGNQTSSPTESNCSNYAMSQDETSNSEHFRVKFRALVRPNLQSWTGFDLLIIQGVKFWSFPLFFTFSLGPLEPELALFKDW